MLTNVAATSMYSYNLDRLTGILVEGLPASVAVAAIEAKLNAAASAFQHLGCRT